MLPPAARATAGAVRAVLAGLVALDLLLAAWGFLAPGLWFRFFHDGAAVDPQALLARCAAAWLAFALVQLHALFVWRRAPLWLAAVAGMRLGDALTDVTCVAFCERATWAAWVLFPVAGAGNVALGLWLLAAARARFSRRRRGRPRLRARGRAAGARPTVRDPTRGTAR
jgi:hypothetical protein